MIGIRGVKAMPHLHKLFVIDLRNILGEAGIAGRTDIFDLTIMITSPAW